jgi:hypothetical protein
VIQVDHLVPQELQDLLVSTGQLEQLEKLDLQDHLVLLELPELPGLRV